MKTIIIPFVAAESKANEIVYLLRSLDKHLKEDFRVVIIGDMPKDIVNVEHIDCRPIGGRLVDSIEKIKMFFSENKDCDSVTRFYDDVYLLKDVENLSLMPNFDFGIFDENSFTGSGHWWDMKAHTLGYLRENEIEAFDGQTHLPITLNKELFEKVAKIALEKELLFESLYISMSEREEHQSITDGIEEAVAYFYGYENKRSRLSNQLADIEKHCEKAIFLNHNDDGLTPELIKFLKNRFPDPCRFEKVFVKENKKAKNKKDESE